MKFKAKYIRGDVVKDNETYVLKDNTTLQRLVISSTQLHPEKSTRGHSHVGQEEVYHFISGRGVMEIKYDDGTEKIYDVESGDIVLVEDGAFHRVHNSSLKEDLYFVCVFEGKRNH